MSTNQLQTQGQVSSSFRSTYDVLVRPPGSRSALEDSRGLVRPNFVSGIYGGITMAHWAAVQAVPGVEVAAPVAYLGYPSTFVRTQVALDRFIASPDQQPNAFAASDAQARRSHRQLVVVAVVVSLILVAFAVIKTIPVARRSLTGDVRAAGEWRFSHESMSQASGGCVPAV